MMTRGFGGDRSGAAGRGDGGGGAEGAAHRTGEGDESVNGVDSIISEILGI